MAVRTEHDATLCEATIDLGAIAHNTELIAETAGTAVMAVVKADGFGHGMLPVARTALAHGATWLGVASISEALRLRASGITAPTLSWLHRHDEDFRPAIRAAVDLSVSSVDHLAAVAASAVCAGEPAQVHLKVDTGLSRNGAPAELWLELVESARRLEEDGVVRVRGIWSHLVHAGRPRAPGVRRQRELFDEAIVVARAAGVAPPVLHLANSAAALGAPGARYDLVRAGIGLYGVEPDGETHGLSGAMTLSASTVLVKTVPAGTGVSYDHRYVTAEKSRLALIPAGYADGVPRAASDRAEVWVAGGRHRVAGRIAMDQFVVDVGNAEVAVGDEVVLFGPGHDGEPTVSDWARWAATIPHEIFTGIGARVARNYHGREHANDEMGSRPLADRKIHVAVLFGGRSSEHRVSCHSAESILTGLDSRRYRLTPVRIDVDGRWSVGDTGVTGSGVLDSMLTALDKLRDVDVVFPALHGPYGEDGTVQSLLVMAGIPFVGNGVLASASGIDKEYTKKLLATEGISVAAGVTLQPSQDSLPDAERHRLGLPLFVKPARAGSSIGVSKVDSWGELPGAIEVARRDDPKVIVEAAVPGREIDLGVLQMPDGEIRVSPPLEIKVPDSRTFFDFEAKYEDSATVFDIPAQLDAATTQELQALAERAFSALDCSGLLRVDCFLTDDGEAVVNEVNTFPGFTAASQYPKMWQAAGMEYPRLLDTLIETALRQPVAAAAGNGG
jgi:alanine racemase